ncbi:MAG: hypothetical protein QHC67_03550 [Sphingobium sp.]|uniref:hypothetical protein n=1 Tax=Sphingobium sp. TaxID=1912891 RepID=UPI0029B1B54C|nr:hypothetical protein [Sphingobium sp.]MDX3908874.1 hypothetical protein [Sphingobium sp.]
MGERYPDHVPRALAEVLGQPPHELCVIYLALRQVGVEVPERYEGEVAAALHFLIPFAISHPENWRAAAADELLRLRDGGTFKPAKLALATS